MSTATESTQVAPRSRLRTRVAHVALILAGLALITWPLTVGAALELNCRGVRLEPGQVCAKAGGAGVQTYEQRVAAGRQSRPVVIALGAGVAAFGVALLVLDVRRRDRGADGPSVRDRTGSRPAR